MGSSRADSVTGDLEPFRGTELGSSRVGASPGRRGRPAPEQQGSWMVGPPRQDPYNGDPESSTTLIEAYDKKYESIYRELWTGSD